LAVAEPATDKPEPIGHVTHAEQLSSVAVVLVLALALKAPDAQASHSRSLLAVAAAVVWKPAAHGELTAEHTAPSSAPDKVAPA
jgi:hypothetical protein